MFREKSASLSFSLLSVVVLGAQSTPVMAASYDPNSPLSQEQQVQLQKAARSMKSRPDKATQVIYDALNGANDIPKCLNIAAYTEPYGAPMLEARRACVTKALSLCQTRQDFLQVALKARRYECFEVTRQAVNSVISAAGTIDDLYDLAHKAQEVALTDVSHLAMEKAYTECRTVNDALKFASEAKLLGYEDLTRKTIRELVDDEREAKELVSILQRIEAFGYKDLNRYLLKKAIDQARTVDDYFAIYEASRHHGEQDIYKLAEWRGKRQQILNKMKEDREAYQKKMEEWKQGMQNNVDQGALKDAMQGPKGPSLGF